MSSRFVQFVKKHAPFLARLARTSISFARQRAVPLQVKKILKQGKEIYVEVGSGDKAGQNGWTTIDRTKHCDLFWDLRKGIPFPDGSVSKIYSSHFFEHLSFKQTQQFLAECMRALSLGGKFLICVPNARIYLEAYVNGTTLDPNVFFGWRPAFNNTTRIDYVNYVAYMDGPVVSPDHRYMFDEENLLFLLNKAGFRNVGLRKFDPSLDMQERDFESIYAVGEK